MKKMKNVFVMVATAIAALSAPVTASAICLGACELALIGLIAAGAGTGTMNTGPQSVGAGDDPAKLRAVVEELRANRGAALIALSNAGGRIGESKSYGFDELLTSQKRAMDLSASAAKRERASIRLAETARSNPKMFRELDNLAAVIEKHFGSERVAEVYGQPSINGQVNFARYAKLASDAQATLANSANMWTW